MLASDSITKSESFSEQTKLQRSPLLITALLAAVGGAVIYLLALPALWRMSWAYGLLFTVLTIAQIGTAIMAFIRPMRRQVLFVAATALIVLVLWALERIFGVLPPPDPWVPMNSAIGFTDDICAALQITALVGLVVAALLPQRSRPTLAWRVLTAVAFIPVIVLVLLVTALGVNASSDGFRGAGFPADVVPPQNLPAGRMSTVEYCRPDGVPLAMDIYMPSAREGSAPAVLYVHGGGLWGDRKVQGLGAEQANHQGALFTPLQQNLNEQGIVVASIDYRLPPGTKWPAPIEDAKCAVRFLRAHAADLGIDPTKIGVWGSSSGGTFAALLGLTSPKAGFDRGQYIDQSSAVQAVVDMFGPIDLNDFQDADPMAQFLIRNAISTSTEVLHLASPITYVNQDAPPFLILHGTKDPLVRPRQSDKLAQSLQNAGIPVTLITVEGAEHDINMPGQSPTPEELTMKIVDFFVTNLK